MLPLMALTSGAWGLDEGGVAPAGPGADAVPAETQQARSFVNDEPREMPGIMLGAIVVNLTIVSVCFFLLWREWRKHKTNRSGGGS